MGERARQIYYVGILNNIIDAVPLPGKLQFSINDWVYYLYQGNLR